MHKLQPLSLHKLLNINNGRYGFLKLGGSCFFTFFKEEFNDFSQSFARGFSSADLKSPRAMAVRSMAPCKGGIELPCPYTLTPGHGLSTLGT